MSKKTNQRLIPKLRFPDFKDDPEWFIHSVDELVTQEILFHPKDGNHGNIHPKASDYVSSGIPFVMANDIKNGEIDLSECVFITKKHADSLQKGFSIEGDVLLTHKGTVGEVAIVKQLSTPYIMLTPQVTYYRIKNTSKLSNKYLVSFFQSMQFQKILREVSGGGTRAYIGILEQGKLKINLPKKLKEQLKIADCLISLSELKAAQRQKIEALKKYKKGFTQQLFPEEGEVVPSLRFPEFNNSNEWEYKSLGDLALRVTEKNRDEKVTRVLTNSAADGIVDQRDFFDKDIANKSNLGGYYVVAKGDYVYNPRISNMAPVGPISKNHIEKGVMSPLYSVFRFYDSENEFYAQYFKTSKWFGYLRSVSNSGARHDRMNITSEEFMNMPMPYPTKEERKKIANFLLSFDELISIEEKKLLEIEKHNQGLLQQLFPTPPHGG